MSEKPLDVRTADEKVRDLNLFPGEFEPGNNEAAAFTTDAATPTIQPTPGQTAAEMLGSSREDAAALNDSDFDRVQPTPVKSTAVSNAVKILLGAGVLIAASVALWPKTVTTTAAQTSPAASPGASGQPTLNAPTPTPTAGAPGGPVTVDIGTSGPGGLDIGDLGSVSAQLAPIDQTCETDSITAFDRAVCSIEGPKRFYACTNQTGRKWDNELPGCNLIDPPSGELYSGVFPGMGKTLLMNRSVMLALSGANDAAIAYSFHRDVAADVANTINNIFVGSADTIDQATRYSMAPFIMTPEERTEKKVPSRFSCMVHVGIAPANISRPELLLDACSGLGSTVPDSRVYLKLLRQGILKIRSDVARAKQFGLMIDLQAGTSYEQQKSYEVSIYNADRFLNVELPEGASALPFFQITLQPVLFSGDLVRFPQKDSDKNWIFCSKSDSNFLSLNQESSSNAKIPNAFFKTGDLSSACLKFEGYTIKNMPKALVIKDYAQFVNAKIDAHLIMLIDSPKMIGTTTYEGEIAGDINSKISGYQLIDVRNPRTLAGTIPANAPGTILTAANIKP